MRECINKQSARKQSTHSTSADISARRMIKHDKPKTTKVSKRLLDHCSVLSVTLLIRGQICMGKYVVHALQRQKTSCKTILGLKIT